MALVIRAVRRLLPSTPPPSSGFGIDPFGTSPFGG